MIRILLLIIFLPACVALAFFIMQKAETKTSNTRSDEDFTVILPSIVAMVGGIEALTSLAVLLGFTFLSDERPHFIFYMVFGFGYLLGMYLIIKTLTFKVIVKKKKVTVFSSLKKPYSFTFDEVVSAVRQVKKNQIKSERIVIKTTSGKRLIVESSEISYKRFAKKVQLEVRKECLVGFE